MSWGLLIMGGITIVTITLAMLGVGAPICLLLNAIFGSVAVEPFVGPIMLLSAALGVIGSLFIVSHTHWWNE